MKLKFSIQEYQTEAVNSIVQIFNGQQIKKSNFTVAPNSILTQGTGNYLNLSEEQILENVRNIQLNNKLTRSTDLSKMNFTIEMETGTGKTYVYTKTILELNKKYGFTKFIIVVPSIAIKEGVYKSFKITEEHFRSLYDNVSYNYFIYDSKKGGQIATFALSTDIQIMIITIGAFISDFGKDSKKSNLMYRPNESINDHTPIDLISNTNPIVIIDEPQSVDNTAKSKEAISRLNPLCQLRYSATHKEKYDLMYKLDAVEAYNKKLVKQISVSSVLSDENAENAYIKLISVSDKKGYSAKVEVKSRKSDGTLEKKVITIKTDDNLKDNTNLECYSNYILDDIDTTPGNEYIQFTTGQILYIGEVIGDIDMSLIKRAQIKTTIATHLKKERQYTKEGIKVLSLFFIDEVSKYRNYDKEGNEIPGEYYKMFEEVYNELINTKFKDLRDSNPDYYDVKKVHDGYFSIDGKGRVKNTNGDTIADQSVYEKIMKNKETLLSFDEPLRFIFSHSALKEGWDNPNVFQVCTLVETKDNMTKRQKIGRGLRLCVNQSGERVENYIYNELTVIANESYKTFADELQKEIEQETNVRFGIIEKNYFADITIKNQSGEYEEIGIKVSEEIYDALLKNETITPSGKITEKGKSDIKYRRIDFPDEMSLYLDDIYFKLDKVNTKVTIKDANKEVSVKLNKEVYLNDDFKELWNKIKHKTTYSVNMNTDEFIQDCIDDIKSMPQIKKQRIRAENVKLNISKNGIGTTVQTIKPVSLLEQNTSYPDPMRYIQDTTNIKRETAYKIITLSERLNDFFDNPQKYLEEVSRIILKNKKMQLVKGIQYIKVNDCYEQSLFEIDNLKAYLDSNAIESQKGVYNYTIYDSGIEKDFAKDMEEDEDCKIYIKLPSWFTIDTPLGNHIPDWAIVMNEDGEDKLYFIVETKGSMHKSDRRGTENGKIECARKHFDALDTNIGYQVATNYFSDFKK